MVRTGLSTADLKTKTYTGLFDEAVSLIGGSRRDQWAYHSQNPSLRLDPGSRYVSGPVTVIHGNQNIYGRSGSFLSSSFWANFIALRIIPQIRENVVVGRSSIDAAIESGMDIGRAVKHSLSNSPQGESLVCPPGEFLVAVDYIIRAPSRQGDMDWFFNGSDGLAAILIGLSPSPEFKKFVGDQELVSIVRVPRLAFANELSVVSQECLIGPCVWAAGGDKPGFGRLQKVLNRYVQDYAVPNLHK